MDPRPGEPNWDVPALAVDPAQREYLRLQDDVWQDETEEFLDRLGLSAGSRVLELNCGLGFDLPRLARRVGPGGEVVALESNPVLAGECRRAISARGLKRVRVALGDQTLDPLPEGPYDVVFCSWKLNEHQKAPDPSAVATESPSLLAGPDRPGPDLRSLLRWARVRLAPSGRIGILEYQSAGLSMFPESPALESLLSALRGSLRRQGQDRHASSSLPGELMACGFMFESAWPRQKAEAPGSPAYRWIEQWLHDAGPRLVREQALQESEWLGFQQEWEQRRVDPKTLLFSPRIVGVIGRAIGP